MSARRVSRPAARSYAARLQTRAVPRPARRWPVWFSGRLLPVLLGLVAEAGHLAAAVVEWPAAPQRGALHVLVAGVQGVVAVGVYFGATRVHLAVGVALNVLVPAAWLVGAVGGIPLYRDYPLPAAAALCLVEVTLAALLAGGRDGRGYR